MSTKSSTRSSAAKKTSASAGEGFTAEEKAAMKERATEVRAARRGGKKDDEDAVLAKLAEMPDADRELAERIHAIVREKAPEATARTWYGMPAYAKDGKVVCFFQASTKFSTRYCTLGFNDAAALDDGALWPTAYAITALSDAAEKQLGALIERAFG